MTSSRETPEARIARVKRILAALDATYPNATCALHFSNPLELLVATILSAQCTDERVNQITPLLFKKYRTARDYANADPETLMNEIRSTGFYRNKARHIIAMATQLVQRHGGRVPDTMQELVALPGVARKTANVVLGTAMGKAEGIVVDTHVIRLSGRLALSPHKDPVKIERDLMALVPRERWVRFGHQLSAHGRTICLARKPRCNACPLRPDCPFATQTKVRP
ncbi:MAG: endonuclease III [bacterium]|nr:endonuclease III [bacterium]